MISELQLDSDEYDARLELVYGQYFKVMMVVHVCGVMERSDGLVSSERGSVVVFNSHSAKRYLRRHLL